jgi:hypothetical protein
MPQTLVTAPDGSKIPVNHPEGATEEQILRYASSQYAEIQKQKESIKQEREPVDLSEYIQETPERFRQTRERYAEAYTTEEYDPRERPTPYGVLGAAAGITTAGETALGVVGEMIQRYAPGVADVASSVYKESVYASPIRQAVELATELSEKYPREATTLEIAGALSVGGPKTSLPRIPEVSPSTIRSATAAATEARLAEQKQQIAKTVEPTSATQGRGRVEPKGPLQTNVYVPDPAEVDVIDYLQTIPEYKASSNPAKNSAVLNNHLTELEGRLQKTVKDAGNPKMKGVDLLDSLKYSLDDFRSSADFADLTDQGRKIAENYIAVTQQKIKALVDKNGDITAKDILDLRRDLDKQIFKRKPKGYIDQPDVSSAKDKVGVQVRNVFNEEFLRLLPTDDAYQSLNGMNMTFKAKDVVDVKAGQSVGSNVISRGLKNLQNSIGISFPTTPVAIGVTIGAGTSLLTQYPALASALGGAIVGYGAARALKPANRKAVVRDLLRLTNQLSRGANVTKETLENLRADRIMLNQMLAEINREEAADAQQQ